MDIKSCTNLDQYIISRREAEYEKIRMNTFISQCIKHCEKSCKCDEKGRKCKLFEVIDFKKFDDKEYLTSLYKSDTLDTMYNMMQSITQSLRSTTGTTFEKIIREILDYYKIDYSYQVLVENSRHTVDFTIPSCRNNIIDSNKFDGIVLSLKTTLRERYFQDKFLKCCLFTITLDNSKDKNIISINPETKAFTEWFKTYILGDKMRVLDLFCGCGGFTEGFKKAGFDVVAGIDIWDKAIETYKKNHDHLSLCKNLTEYTASKLNEEHNIGDIDIIIGGPPCQGFSNAGKRDVKDPRNSLFMEFKKYLDYFMPRMFIMENVIGILSMKNQNGAKCIDIITELLEENYNLCVSKLYASDFGVPQNRRRVLIFGIRKDLDIIPYEPKPLCQKNERQSVSTILESKEDVDKSYFLSKKALEGIMRKKSRMKEEGKGFGAQFLDFDKPSYTIPSRYWKDGYDALVKYSDDDIRRLTVLELARIQSFPDSYSFAGSKKEQIMQIGNAVACEFAFHMANHLKKMIKNTEDCIDDSGNLTLEELHKLGVVGNLTFKELHKLGVVELRKMCKNRKIKRYSTLKKAELISLLSS